MENVMNKLNGKNYVKGLERKGKGKCNMKWCWGVRNEGVEEKGQLPHWGGYRGYHSGLLFRILISVTILRKPA